VNSLDRRSACDLCFGTGVVFKLSKSIHTSLVLRLAFSFEKKRLSRFQLLLFFYFFYLIWWSPFCIDLMSGQDLLVLLSHCFGWKAWIVRFSGYHIFYHPILKGPKRKLSNQMDHSIKLSWGVRRTPKGWSTLWWSWVQKLRTLKASNTFLGSLKKPIRAYRGLWVNQGIVSPNKSCKLLWMFWTWL